MRVFASMPEVGNPYGLRRSSLPGLARQYERGLVSIIIPCYNSARFIALAIESALLQDYACKEIIVIDDGSTDGSLAVFAGFGDRIIWRHKEKNGGAPAARNDGLELARGEFIQFLDGDDILAGEAVSRRLSAMTAEADAVFGDMRDIDEGGAELATGCFHRGWPIADSLLYVLTPNIHTPLPLHRRISLYPSGGFDEGLPCAQEAELHLRLVANGYNFVHIPGIVAYRRQHSGDARINNYGWCERDPERFLKVFRCQLAAVTAVPERITPGFLEHFAGQLWRRGVEVGAVCSGKIAWQYFEFALQLCPSYRPSGGLSRYGGCFLSASQIGRLQSLWRRIRMRLGRM